MNNRQLSALKATLFLLALLPLFYLAWGASTDTLGANPIETLSRKTGTWTFNFLLITLCVTPLRKLTQWHWLIRLRRMLGLFAFFYACLHFTTYLWLDQFFDLASVARDIVKRPFITVGFAAFVLLIPLAVTSNNRAIKQLGGARWQQLHYSIYAIAILACIHYFWLVKPIALLYPLMYALMVAALLGFRARERIRRFGPYPVAGTASSAAAEAKPIRFFRSRPPPK